MATVTKKITSFINTILKLAVAVALIYWVYSKGYLDADQLKILFEIKHLAALGALVMLNFALCHLRWFTLLKSRDFKVGYFAMLPLGLIGLFFNFAIPGGVGGDLVKGYYLIKDQTHRKTDAVISILLDRVLGLYSMFVLAALSIAVSWGTIGLSISSGAAGSLTVFVIGVFLAFSVFLSLSLSSQLRGKVDSSQRVERWRENKIFKKFLQVYEAIQSYRDQPLAVIRAIGFSLTAQFLTVVFFWYAGSVVLETNFSFLTYLFIVPVGFVVTSVPIAPGGIGVGQMAFLFLTSMYTGQKSEIGPLALTLFQILLFCLGLVGGYFYIRRGRK